MYMFSIKRRKDYNDHTPRIINLSDLGIRF